MRSRSCLSSIQQSESISNFKRRRLGATTTGPRTTTLAALAIGAGESYPVVENKAIVLVIIGDDGLGLNAQ